MNRRNSIIGVLFLAASSAFLFNGCKDESSPPTITVNGANPQTVTLQSSYTELGATATDAEDGDISGNIITDASGVDANTKGSYSVSYEVSDSDGNYASESRDVDVVNSAESYAGTYQVIDSCGVFPGGDIFNYSQVVTTSDIVNNRLQFNKFGDYSNNGGIYADVSGNALSLPLQTAAGIGSSGETHSFTGTGYKISNGFVVLYTDVNITVGATAQCRAWYTK